MLNPPRKTRVYFCCWICLLAGAALALAVMAAMVPASAVAQDDLNDIFNGPPTPTPATRPDDDDDLRSPMPPRGDATPPANGNENGNGRPATPPADDPFDIPPIPEDATPQERMTVFMERGRQLMEEGKYNEAITLFSQIIAFDGRQWPAYWLRGRAFAALKEYDLAMQSYARAIQVGGRQQPEMFVDRGKIYMLLGNYREALDDFTVAVEAQPANAAFQLERGRALAKVGADLRQFGDPQGQASLEAAVRTFDRIIAARPNDAKALYERALAHADLGEAEKGLADLRQAVQLEPESADYQSRLAYLLLQWGSQQFVDTNEDASAARDTVRQSIAAFGRALELCESAADLDDNYGNDPDEHHPRDLYLARAIARLRLAEYDSPGNDDGYRHAPPTAEQLRERDEQIDEAIKDCDASLKHEPRQPVVLFNRGLAYRLKNDYRRAIESLGEAIRLAPEYTDARLRRGICWYYLGDHDLALIDFTAANVLGLDPRAMLWAGIVLAEQGRYAEAVTAYSGALRRQRQYPLAYANRAVAYLHLGEFERAIADFNALIAFDETDPVPFYRRGLAYEALERTDNAISSYEQAVSRRPDYKEAHRRLAELYARRGESEKAEEHRRQM